jgi:hypothetical protein
MPSTFDTLRQLASADLFNKPANAAAAEEAVEFYAALGTLEGLIKERKEALRACLLKEAEEKGTNVGDKGAREAILSKGKVVKEKKTAANPDPEKLKMMVKEKGLPVSTIFEELTVFELNPSKLEYAISTGKLDRADVDSLRSITYSLRVTPSKELKRALEDAAGDGL